MALIMNKKTGITGGTSSDLDSIDGATLVGGEIIFVIYNGYFLLYEVDATSGAAADPPFIVIPVTNPGDIRFILQSHYLARSIVLGASGAGVAAGTTAGYAKTTNGISYIIENKIYTKAATDDLFNLTGVSTGAAEYKKVTLYLDASGNGQIKEGVAAASQAAAEISRANDDAALVGIVEIPNNYSGGSLAGFTFYDVIGSPER